jgi:hypothetical protein
MADDLTDEDRQILINMLTVEIEASKFPVSPSPSSLRRRQGRLFDRPLSEFT